MPATDHLPPASLPSRRSGIAPSRRLAGLATGRPGRDWKWIFALSLLIWLHTAILFAADTFTILTEELPPYSYGDGQAIKGVAVDLVREVLRRINHPDTIEIRSWSVAYSLTKNNEHYALFSTSRTKERENLFQWVGPLLETKLVVFGRKGSGVVVNSLDDMRKVAKIGTYKDDVSELFLKSQGFTNLESVFVSGQNAQKLAAGRVDLWVDSLAVGFDTAKRAGVADKLEPLFTLGDQMMYIAFNRGAPKDVLAKWQNALDQMKADGTCKAILQRSGIAE